MRHAAADLIVRTRAQPGARPAVARSFAWDCDLAQIREIPILERMGYA